MEKIKKLFSNSCDKESCWLKQKCLAEDLDRHMVHKLFAPKMPRNWKKNPKEWLTSVDIMNIMKQYEYANNDFQFLGPSPIDYDTHIHNGECVWEELCEFNLKKQYNLENER